MKIEASQRSNPSLVGRSTVTGLAKARRAWGFVALALFASYAGGALAGSLPVLDGLGGGFARLNVTSFQEGKFHRTVQQERDFSCGSAAIATLLTYHYEDPATEDEVFAEMMTYGDAERIRAQGFSMLDMKDYLARRGYQSGGYQAPLDILLKADVPAIVLINTEGYLHFVVVKGLTNAFVLIGDPALGASIQERETFEQSWTGVVFVIIDHDTQGRKSFNQIAEWDSWWVKPTIPEGSEMLAQQSLSSFLTTLSTPVTSFTLIPGGPNVLERLF